MRNFIPGKKEHKSDYFRVIDSEVKAYILGYIVADGSIEESVRKDRPSKLIRLRFGCVTEDDEIIKLIQKEIAPNNKLRFYQPKAENHKQVTILQICDKELINDLRTLYNIQPRKTYDEDFEFPNIPSKYERDFISISKKTGEPVYNSFIDIANERSWEVSQKDYQDKISVTKSLESLTSNISEYQSDLEKEVQDFLDTKFYSTGIFEKKMKMYCEFMDLHHGNKEVSDLIYFKIKDPKYRKYYNFYGTKGCRAVSYIESKLKLGMINESKESELSSVVYQKFKAGDRIIPGEVKIILQDIYRDLGITSKAKATDLGKYFTLKRTRVTLPDKTVKEGYLLKSL